MHVAIIMDGNRRWAKRNSVDLRSAYGNGVARLQDLIQFSANSDKISALSVYAFSINNMQRSHGEVQLINELFFYYLQQKLGYLITHSVKLLIIGDRSNFTLQQNDLVTAVEVATENGTHLTLQIAFYYSARQEILQAVQSIISQVQNSNIENIDQKFFEEHLHTTGADPDLLIRTSGEQRLSDYMLWQLSNTELFFEQKLWPDFTVEDFQRILRQYNHRDRRFGV
jgi:undecaprenyl diphosphate synthase